MSGPSPLYQPRFPAEFLVQARDLIRRRTARAHLQQRARLALLLADRPGLSNVEAGLPVHLHPNGLQEVEVRLRLYEELTNRQPRPFNWKFTKYDLFDLLQRLASKDQAKPRPAVSKKPSE